MTNYPGAVTNRLVRPSSLAAAAPNSKDPVEQEFQKLMEADDDVQAEVDRLIQDNNEFAAKGAGVQPGSLRQRILERFEPVRKAYEDFIQRHPTYSRARV